VRKQVGRVAAAIAVVGAMVSGCGGVDQAGSAVIVGNDAVPLARVQSQLDVALSKTDQIAQLTAQGGTTADLSRSIVTREVLHDLLQRRAAEDGIVVTDAQVEAELAGSGGADAIVDGSLYDASTLRQRVRDDLTAAQLAQRAVGGLAVTVDLVAATSRADAEAKAKALASGGPAAEALFGDSRTSARGETVQAAAAPNDAGTVLFGVPVGGVVAFQPNPQQSTWIVFKVTQRRTDAPSDPATVSSISQSQLINIGDRLLQPDAEALGVRVNPRYGVWDPIQLRVVADGQQAGMILQPPAAAAG
jgi:SurA N-terminal domain